MERLIIDIGMHRGDDADFYLRKGFRVVGVEANPVLAQECRARFASQIAEGRMEVVEAALHDSPGDVVFYANSSKDDWSSTVRVFGTRDGTAFKELRVPAITMAELFERHVRGGEVHYLKSDIEGGDRHVLEGLVASTTRPRYISVEAHEPWYMAHLFVAGYRRFKLVNQNLNWKTVLPDPPREGLHVRHTFGEHSSGPFGEETVGTWRSFDSAMELYFALRRAWTLEPALSNAWYDIHAAMPE